MKKFIKRVMLVVGFVISARTLVAAVNAEIC